MGNRRAKQIYNFEDWCKFYDKTDWLKYWDYEHNTKDPKDIRTRETGQGYFLCKDALDVYFKVEIGTITHDCKSYEEFYQTTFFYSMYCFLGEEWRNFWSKNNVCSPGTLKKKSSRVKIYLVCSVHGEKETTPREATNSRCLCPICQGRGIVASQRAHKLGYKRKRRQIYPTDDNLLESFPYILDYWSEDNKFSPDGYTTNSNAVVKFKCDENKHSDYPRKIREATLSNFACPKCLRERTWSRLQRKVYDYIAALGFEIRNERECTFLAINPITGYPLPYDNEIVDKKLIIEVQGIQHFHDHAHPEQMDKNAGNTRSFRDAEKKKQAIEKGYNYLEIPFYSEYKDGWRDMIDIALSTIERGERYF